MKTKTGEEIDLELYKFDSCPYCQKVFAAIKRLGIAGIRMQDIMNDGAAAKKLVAVGGDDQVPCLFVDGKPLYESDDIIAFLESKFAPAGKAK